MQIPSFHQPDLDPISPKNKELQNACLEGDATALQRLIQDGVNVNHYCELHHPLDLILAKPLLLAAGAGQTECVRLLLEAGADVNFAWNSEGMSAIFVAQKAEVIKLLIDAGADVNARDFNRNTALMYARTTQAAKLLLDAGADIHAVNRQRMTVLMGTHSSRCTKLLIDAGADVNAQSRAGLTPLMYSTNAKSTRYLLEAGANPSAIDKEGQTPLMWCVDGTSAQYLIDAGADVNAMSYDTTTPLLAAIYQLLEPGGMIVETGGLREILGVADPLKDRLETILDTAMWDNATACHKTSYFKGIVDKIKVLVKAGADVNKKHIIPHSMSYSWPPLMTLCCYCDKLMAQQDLVLSVAKLLIEAGADPLAKNSDGQTAEDLSSDNPKLADYLHGLTHFPEELDLFK